MSLGFCTQKSGICRKAIRLNKKLLSKKGKIKTHTLSWPTNLKFVIPETPKTVTSLLKSKDINIKDRGNRLAYKQGWNELRARALKIARQNSRN